LEARENGLPYPRGHGLESRGFRENGRGEGQRKFARGGGNEK